MLAVTPRVSKNLNFTEKISPSSCREKESCPCRPNILNILKIEDLFKNTGIFMYKYFNNVLLVSFVICLFLFMLLTEPIVTVVLIKNLQNHWKYLNGNFRQTHWLFMIILVVIRQLVTCVKFRFFGNDHPVCMNRVYVCQAAL